jgi:hypothetical protein
MYYPGDVGFVMYQMAARQVFSDYFSSHYKSSFYQLLHIHQSPYHPRYTVPIMIKSKAIPVTGHGGPYGCETSELPHFLDNRLTDGGEVVSLTRWPPFTP